MPVALSSAILRGAFDEIDWVAFLRLLLAVGSGFWYQDPQTGHKASPVYLYAEGREDDDDHEGPYKSRCRGCCEVDDWAGLSCGPWRAAGSLDT